MFIRMSFKSRSNSTSVLFSTRLYDFGETSQFLVLRFDGFHRVVDRGRHVRPFGQREQICKTRLIGYEHHAAREGLSAYDCGPSWPGRLWPVGKLAGSVYGTACDMRNAAIHEHMPIHVGDSELVRSWAHARR